MELWKIALAAVGLMLSLLLIAFRLRQLYLFIPKMFEYTPFAENGRVIGLTLINRGWHMEEDLRLEMPPELKVELLAADTTGIEQKKSIVSINRLPQRTEVRLVLLVEGLNGATDFAPSLTSKTSKGKVFKSEDVPPNIGLVAVLVFALLGALSLVGYFVVEVSKRNERMAALSETTIKRTEQARNAELDRANRTIKELDAEVEKLLRVNAENDRICAKTQNDLLVAKLKLSDCKR